jgi:hypothetical protein
VYNGVAEIGYTTTRNAEVIRGPPQLAYEISADPPGPGVTEVHAQPFHQIQVGLHAAMVPETRTLGEPHAVIGAMRKRSTPAVDKARLGFGWS